MSPRSRAPSIRCYPKDDGAFAAVVRAAAARISGDEQSRIRRVQSIVRTTYPNAIIHPRENLAAPVDDFEEVWYAFRDGKLITRRETPEQ